MNEAPNQKWDHKDVWRRRSKYFGVEISRHSELVQNGYGCYDSEGPHRWAVYAYVYPGHPHFKAFDPEGGMSQDACASLRLHGYPSFFKVHRGHTGEINSVQTGADYHHLHDWRFTQMASQEDAYEVFQDAEELFQQLTRMEQP